MVIEGLLCAGLSTNFLFIGTLSVQFLSPDLIKERAEA